MVDKGKISALKDGGTTAEVIPSQSSSAVTTTLTVPQLLQGNLSVNTEVVYAVFEDNTGIILDLSLIHISLHFGVASMFCGARTLRRTITTELPTTAQSSKTPSER